MEWQGARSAVFVSGLLAALALGLIDKHPESGSIVGSRDEQAHRGVCRPKYRRSRTSLCSGTFILPWMSAQRQIRRERIWTRSRARRTSDRTSLVNHEGDKCPGRLHSGFGCESWRRSASLPDLEAGLERQGVRERWMASSALSMRSFACAVTPPRSYSSTTKDSSLSTSSSRLLTAISCSRRTSSGACS